MRFAKDRKADTWDDEVCKSIAFFSLKIMQGLSDQGSALKNYFEVILAVPMAIDLFHVLYELSKAVGPHFRRQLKSAKKASQEVIDHPVKEVSETPNSGKKFPFKAPISVRTGIQSPSKGEQKIEHPLVQKAKDDLYLYHERVNGLSRAYHIFGLGDGKKRNSVLVEKEMNALLDQLMKKVMDTNAPQGAIDGIDTAMSAVKIMGATIAWVHAEIEKRVEELKNPPLQELLLEKVIPGLYISSFAEKCPGAGERKRLKSTSKILLKCLKDPKGVWASLSEKDKEVAWSTAKFCSAIFQRSTAVVEGENGRFRLNDHKLQGMDEEELEVQRVLRNFWATRKDESTAAERFFETKHRNLFEELCKTMPPPARPRFRRRASDQREGHPWEQV